MTSVKVYNQAGDSVGTVELNPKIFGVEKLDRATIHQVITGLQANTRNTVASTKTRGEVRGGGRKPWKQKGTGRARHGSIRSPLWVGGGVTFGPRPNRNYSKKINKKQKSLVLKHLLTLKAKEDKFIIVDNWEITEPKAKVFAKQLRDLGTKLPVGRKILLVTSPVNENIVRATRNLPNIKVTAADNLGIMDLVTAESVIVTKAALAVIEKTRAK